MISVHEENGKNRPSFDGKTEKVTDKVTDRVIDKITDKITDKKGEKDEIN